jgi:hypothetical protein
VRRQHTVLASSFVAAVALAGAAALGLSLRGLAQADHGWWTLAWITIACATLVAGSFSIRLPLPNCRVSFADALIFLSVLSFGTDFATVTGALDGFSASTRRGGAWTKRVFNTAAIALTVNLASRLFYGLVPGGLRGPWRFFPRDFLLPIVVLVLAQYLLNALLIASVVALKEGVPFAVVWERSFPWAGFAALVGSAAAAFVFLLMRESGPGLILAVIPFPVIVYAAYRASLRRPAETNAP